MEGETHRFRTETSRDDSENEAVRMVESLRGVVEQQQQQITLQQEQINSLREELLAARQQAALLQEQINLLTEGFVTAQKQQRESQQQLVEFQVQQTTLLSKGVAAAQQTATEALERVMAPKEQKIGNAADFRKFEPKMFSGNEEPLQAEQWLVDTENLLKIARVPEADYVDIVKIQLIDVARSWWLAEETSLAPPISWKQFTDRFNEQFFPVTARREMKEEFLNLEQKHRTVDEYAAEFSRLSGFATNVVATEEGRIDRFQQGLRFDIQMQLAPHQWRTYSEVLAAARRVERFLEKQNRAKTEQNKAEAEHNRVSAERSRTEAEQRTKKRPYEQVVTESPPRSNPSPPKERTYLFCGFCRKAGHLREDCRRRNRQCLVCGAEDHRISDCPIRLQQDLSRGTTRYDRRGNPIPLQQIPCQQPTQGTGTGTGTETRTWAGTETSRGTGSVHSMDEEPSGTSGQQTSQEARAGTSRGTSSFYYVEEPAETPSPRSAGKPRIHFVLSCFRYSSTLDSCFDFRP